MPESRSIFAAPTGPPASADLAVFDVTLDPEGPAFLAGPDESVLDAALRQGVLLPYGCRNGACGACRGKVLAGRVHLAEGAGLRGLTEREIRAGGPCSARPGPLPTSASRHARATPARACAPSRSGSRPGTGSPTT